MARAPIEWRCIASALAAAHQAINPLGVSLVEVMLAADGVPKHAEVATQIADIEAALEKSREHIADLNVMEGAR